MTASVKDGNAEKLSTNEGVVLATINVGGCDEIGRHWCKSPYKCQTQEKNTISRFWTTLFGEKKCTFCNERKTKCLCNDIAGSKYTKKNMMEIGGEEAHLKLKQKEQDTNCKANNLVKYMFPLVKRGCGAHLYFCIDNERDRIRIKKKHVIDKRNERIKLCKPAPTMEPQEPLKEAEMELDNSPKITIVCDKSTEKMANNYLISKTSPTIGSCCKEGIKINIGDKSEIPSSVEPFFPSPSPRQNPFRTRGDIDVYNEQSKNEDPFERQSQREKDDIDEKKYKNSKPEDFDKDANETNNKNLVEKRINYFENNMSPRKGPDRNGSRLYFTENENFRSSQPNSKTDEESKTRKRQSILRKNSKEKIDNGNVQVTAIVSTENLKLRSQGGIRASDDDSTSDYDNISNKKKKRSALYKSGIFAKNSLISVRRERKQSQLEGRVSLILSKLSSLENKINELQNNQQSRVDENKIADISPIIKSSEVSVKVEQLSGGENIEVLTIPPPNIRENTINKIQNKIELMTKDGGLYVNVPKNTTVVKPRKCLTQDEIKRVMHHNAYEMDAHYIASKHFNTVKCNNPQIFIECPKTKTKSKEQQRTKQTPPQDKWHRISEELKISGTDITLQCKGCKIKNQ